MVSRHLLIKGRVQGVFYRDSARKEAEKLDITGWVKNNKDGSVEAIVTGAPADVLAFVQWCKQGPPQAIVKEVIVTELATQNFESFLIIRRN
jgi:acylphosphatase